MDRATNDRGPGWAEINKWATRSAPGSGKIKVERVRVKNLKSFRDSGWIEFSPGFNVVVGSNNAGKTALLEAIAGDFSYQPHRSLRTVPHPGEEPDEIISVDLDLGLSGKELERVFLRKGKMRIPSRLVDKTENEEGEIESVLPVGEDESCIVTSGYEMREEGRGPGQEARGKLGIDLMGETMDDSHVQHAEFRNPPNSRFWSQEKKYKGEPANLGHQIQGHLFQRVYLFEAERFNVGESTASTDLDLDQNAGNLPTVLHNLRSRNRVRFDRLVDHVQEVFPEVRDISTELVQNADRIQAKIWHVYPETERHDLTIPLDEAGTGLGQAIGIIYLLVTSEESQIILIDEPQSFLHPGALKKLLSIMGEYADQHQFIFSTHAPSVIAATDPGTINNLTLKDGESSVETIDGRKARELRSVLSEVGVRPSDLFGADEILWVEGPTEERCFPLIIEGLLEQPLMGTEVLGVVDIGGLEAKDDKAVKRTFDIYRNLSVSPILIPPALAFILDSENREDRDRQELDKRCPTDLVFLPRRMYENYLLHPEGIASVISTTDGVDSIAAEEVEGWIENSREQEDFLDGDLDEDQRWKDEVDAANLLEEMFPALTDNQLVYRKVEHGRALTEWLIENDEGDLEEIADFLAEVLPEERAVG